MTTWHKLLFLTGYPIYDASCVALNTVRKWLEDRDTDGKQNAELVRLFLCLGVFVSWTLTFWSIFPSWRFTSNAGSRVKNLALRLVCWKSRLGALRIFWVRLIFYLPIVGGSHNLLRFSWRRSWSLSAPFTQIFPFGRWIWSGKRTGTRERHRRDRNWLERRWKSWEQGKRR